MVSSLQFLLRPDDGSLMRRNEGPMKRVLSDLLGPIVELNKIYANVTGIV
jgi:hypothetical protein